MSSEIPWITLIIIVGLFALGVFQCQREAQEDRDNPMIRSKCAEGVVWYKYRSQDYWTLSGPSENKPPTKCSGE